MNDVSQQSINTLSCIRLPSCHHRFVLVHNNLPHSEKIILEMLRSCIFVLTSWIFDDLTDDAYAIDQRGSSKWRRNRVETL
jgi:hypothetical protein